MDNATIAAIVTCLITGLLSAGGWKFYEAVLRQKADQRKEEKNERLAYRDDLIKRVDFGLEPTGGFRANREAVEGDQIMLIVNLLPKVVATAKPLPSHKFTNLRPKRNRREE